MSERLKTFTQSANNCSRSLLEKEFQELQGLESPQRRGQLFDYFTGLLFQQMDNAVVKCRFDEDNPGELDVIANFTQGPEWAFRSIGSVTGVENKWEKDAAVFDDIYKFKGKVTDLNERQGTRVGFFVSMNGYTADAKNELNNGTPRVIGFKRDDIIQMIADATAEDVLKDAVFY